MKRAVAGVLALAGLVMVICAAMGAIVLGPHGTWHTSVHVPAGRSAVVVEPALASVLGPTITVRATAAEPGDEKVALFVGRTRPDDAQALVENSDRLVVSGLDGARELVTRQTYGNDPMPAMDDVDVWRSRAAGAGDVALTYRPARGAESAVVTRADGQELPALDLTLSWSDRVWFWIPSTLLLVGIGLLVLARRVRRPAAAVPLPPTRPSARGPRPAPTRASRRRRNQHVGRRRATSARGRTR